MKSSLPQQLAQLGIDTGALRTRIMWEQEQQTTDFQQGAQHGHEKVERERDVIGLWIFGVTPPAAEGARPRLELAVVGCPGVIPDQRLALDEVVSEWAALRGLDSYIWMFTPETLARLAATDPAQHHTITADIVLLLGQPPAEAIEARCMEDF